MSLQYFCLEYFQGNVQDLFTKGFDFVEKLQEKLLFSAFPFSYNFAIDQNTIRTNLP